MSVATDYLLHLRFTLREFRDNARRVGMRCAARFFIMRVFVPLGRPSRYFMRRQSPSASVRAIDATGFVELAPVEPRIVRSILAQLLARVSRQARECGESPRCVEEYVSTLERSQIERQTGLISDGSPECAAAVLARADRFAKLAVDYLERDPSDLIVEASVDTLVPLDKPRQAGGYDNALEFHRDVDGFRFLKMFVYLTDCFEGCGHHEIYLRSHRHYPLQLGPIRRYSMQEIERYIPTAVLKKVTGPAGYAFAENTVAFHRGTRPQHGYRIILNLIYTEKSFGMHFPDAFALVPANRSETSAKERNHGEPAR